MLLLSGVIAAFGVLLLLLLELDVVVEILGFLGGPSRLPLLVLLLAALGWGGILRILVILLLARAADILLIKLLRVELD